MLDSYGQSEKRWTQNHFLSAQGSFGLEEIHIENKESLDTFFVAILADISKQKLIYPANINYRQTRDFFV